MERQRRGLQGMTFFNSVETSSFCCGCGSSFCVVLDQLDFASDTWTVVPPHNV